MSVSFGSVSSRRHLLCSYICLSISDCLLLYYICLYVCQVQRSKLSISSSGSVNSKKTSSSVVGRASLSLKPKNLFTRYVDIHSNDSASSQSSYASTSQHLVSVDLFWLCNGKVLDLWLRGCGFNSQSGHYQVFSTWMADCLQTSKPCQYITSTKFIHLW